MITNPLNLKKDVALLNAGNALVIVPTYNEADNIDRLFAEIWQAVPNIHILVVDDNSKDGTAELVQKYQQQKPQQTHLLQRAGKLGLGTAYITGFNWALERDYQAIIEMDADLSHDPATLPQMLEELQKTPAVVGSRYIPGGGTENWSIIRKMISKFGSFYARTILGMKVRDLTGGFNAWRAEVLRGIDPNSVRSEGYAFQIELKYRAQRRGFAIVEIPILFKERRAGQSKMSARIVVEAMFRVWKLKFNS